MLLYCSVPLVLSLPDPLSDAFGTKVTGYRIGGPFFSRRVLTNEPGDKGES